MGFDFQCAEYGNPVDAPRGSVPLYLWGSGIVPARVKKNPPGGG